MGPRASTDRTDRKIELSIRRSLGRVLLGATLGLSMAASAQELPSSMTWSAYDVGSSGYAEASAIADAFGKKYGTRVRIQPSGSAIGRLQPILNDRADVGYLATETFFAAEGTQMFADRQWGPQDLRVLAGRPASGGLVTAADADIRELGDVEGKRVAYVAGNPSVNLKLDAMLAFSGLTREDVQAITFPTYGAAMSSLAEGLADATFTVTTPSQMYQLAESPRGIHWVEIPEDFEEGWAQMDKVAPIFAPFTESIGAGLSEENTARLVAYRYPMVVTKADFSSDEAYAFTKALDETYDLYKDATAIMPRWDLEQSGTPPVDAPFHEGAIRYLKEKGIWTEEHQAWNDRRSERLNALLEAWPKAIAEGEGKSDEEFAQIWERHRQDALSSL